MEVQLNKTYLTKQGRFVKMVNLMNAADVFNGEYEERVEGKDSFGRWTQDGRGCNCLFMSGWFMLPATDIIMEDSEEARELAHTMLLERKMDAYINAK